jgi:hypothetical protein
LSGGGLYGCYGPVTNCSIRDNYAERFGGGFCGFDPFLPFPPCHNGSFKNCTITGNVSNDAGGGLYGCDGDIINCVIAENNSKEGDGGGLCECNGHIINCTVAQNWVGDIETWTGFGRGGGIYHCNGIISNCIIWWNFTLSENDLGVCPSN